MNILRNFFVENLWADSLNSKYINSFWIDVIWIKVITKPQQRFCSILQGLVFFYFGCFLFKNLSIFVKAWCLISKTKQSRNPLWFIIVKFIFKWIFIANFNLNLIKVCVWNLETLCQYFVENLTWIFCDFWTLSNFFFLLIFCV